MIIGTDIGGSHITAALIDEQTLKILPGSLVRAPVDAKGTANEILDEWAATILQACATHCLSATKTGIAMPGPFDYEAGVALMKGTEKYEALYGHDIRTPLADRLRIDPSWIMFRNDAEAFLSGEMMAGAGIGFAHAVGITLGTGLGSATYHNGTAKDAARWGHPMYDGIAEDFISTRFLTKRYELLSGVKMKDARSIAVRVPNDAIAQQVFRECCVHLSLFLKNFIADEQPAVIIIGGNIANAWAIIYPELEQLMQEELKTVAIKKASLGEEAALIGSACWWL